MVLGVRSELRRLFTEHLPAYLTHFSVISWFTVSALRGPLAEVKGIGGLTRGSLRNWNIHEWEWK